jgi:hypothetical protein
VSNVVNKFYYACFVLESESRKSVSSSVKLAIIRINKCLEFYILLVNQQGQKGHEQGVRVESLTMAQTLIPFPPAKRSE